MTHATLLARVAAGTDAAAWQEFCNRYAALIQGFAQRQGLQEADCDEVVQESLLALAKAMPNFEYDRSKGKFRSYLKTIVLHEIFRRSRQKHGEVLLGEVDDEVAQAAADSEIERVWEAQWRQYHIRQAMSVIEMEYNEKDRAAFEAYAVAGREAAEVAAELALSVDQVYQAKSRIMKRLSQIIQQQVEEEG
jgi:RNA polymerase sigma-70 factor (ECF subfamily)